MGLSVAAVPGCLPVSINFVLFILAFDTRYLYVMP